MNLVNSQLYCYIVGSINLLAPIHSIVMPPTVVNETTRLLRNHVEESYENNEADIVDWDGPNDPANPQNWPRAKTWIHVLIVSLLTFLV